MATSKVAPANTAGSAAATANALRVFFGRLRRHMQDASAVGELTAPQASALARLLREQPSSASELAGAERVRPQSMAATLGVLERRGLIARTPDPSDGRRQLISLTREGRAHAKGARAHRDEWLISTISERFSPAERATIDKALALLERIVER